ncbi:MAG: hypothetical protein RIR73_1426 [Chloroflexota bacterium]
MKPKSTFPKNIVLWILVAVLVLSGIIALVAAFNSGDDAETDVNAVYTNAAATVAAQQLTLQASAPSATSTSAFTPTATFTAAPLASPTLFTNLPIASNTVSAPSGAVGCNNSAYVSDVTFPDDTVVTPGQTFTKTWKLSNTGSCPWTTTYKVSFVSGNAMGGVATPLTVTVAPGASGDISVAMTAPAAAGDAIGYWILTNDSGQNFGTSFYVKVKVGGTATTGTAVTGTPGTVTATLTSSVPTPVAANNPVIILTCTPNGAQYEYTGQLTWEDKSTNEQGFNIYVGGILADIAPADTTSYQVKLNGRVTNVLYAGGTPITYSVEAFNAGGKALQANVVGQCP